MLVELKLRAQLIILPSRGGKRLEVRCLPQLDVATAIEVMVQEKVLRGIDKNRWSLSPRIFYIKFIR